MTHERRIEVRWRDVDALLGLQLSLEGFDQRRDALHGLVLVVLRVAEVRADPLVHLRRRAVMHDALPEGDRAGVPPDPFPDDRDHRRLHRREARGLTEGSHCGAAYYPRK